MVFQSKSYVHREVLSVNGAALLPESTEESYFED
jgi:hypothetical protein